MPRSFAKRGLFRFVLVLVLDFFRGMDFEDEDENEEDGVAETILYSPSTVF
jgi:hypothetical protein